MSKKRTNRRIKPRTKEQMKEIADIVKNSETDEAALEFLQDTLEDDFPDLDLGSMNLHEATRDLGGSEPERKPRKNNVVENLNESLGKFIDGQERNHNKRKVKRRRRRKRKKRR